MKDGPEQRHFDAVLENQERRARLQSSSQVSAFLGILIISLRVKIIIFLISIQHLSKCGAEEPTGLLLAI